MHLRVEKITLADQTELNAEDIDIEVSLISQETVSARMTPKVVINDMVDY